MVGEFLDVLVELGLAMGDIFLIVLFLFDEVFAFGLDFIDLIFLFSDDLFIGFLQILNSFLKEFILFEKFFVFLFLRLNWFGLFG